MQQIEIYLFITAYNENIEKSFSRLILIAIMTTILRYLVVATGLHI